MTDWHDETTSLLLDSFFTRLIYEVVIVIFILHHSSHVAKWIEWYCAVLIDMTSIVVIQIRTSYGYHDTYRIG